jgi:hypothetical protein
MIMSNEFINQLYEEAVSAIAENDASTELSHATKQKARVEISADCLDKLKEKLLGYTFTSTEEEIMFFKHIKPRFSSLLLYHSVIESIELGRPEGSFSKIRSYYELKLKDINNFFNSNREVYSYYRSEEVHLDTILFLRGQKIVPRWLYGIRVDQDERFTTAADFLFARIIANLKIAKYLENAMSGILCPNPIEEETEKITWTGETINLLEVVYGWYYTGQINNGQASITTLVKKMEKVFNVNIGRPYRRLSEIRQRKRLSRTKFIDEMGKAITRKLDDEDDLNPLHNRHDE